MQKRDASKPNVGAQFIAPLFLVAAVSTLGPVVRFILRIAGSRRILAVTEGFVPVVQMETHSQHRSALFQGIRGGRLQVKIKH